MKHSAKKHICLKCDKQFQIMDQPPESPVKGAWGWYCSVACWRDVEGPVDNEKTDQAI